MNETNVKAQRLKGILGLMALSLVMFIVTLDTTITNIALPTITEYFNTSLTTSNWISTVYVLVLSVFIIPASKLADQFGRKKWMLIGLTAFGIGSALCGVSHSVSFLILMRVFQGIGGAIITPVMIPLSVETFGREKAGSVVGLIGAVTAVAAASGPPIGGLLVKYVNWQSIFYVNVPIAIFTFTLICICFSESFDHTISKKIDWIGMFLLSIGLFQLTFVLIKGYSYGWTSPTILLLILGAVFSLSLFGVIEYKMKEPLIEFRLFKEITFTASTFGYFICGFAIVCSSLIFNYFLQNVRSFSALHAAYIVMSMSLTVIISMPLGSFLAKKVGYKPVIFPGILLMSVSTFFLSRLSISTPTRTMVFYMVILGFGFGLSCQSLVSACKFIPQTKAGIASGIVNASRQLGTCLGIALLVGMMTNNVDIAKDTIENNSIQNIEKANIDDSIKEIMIADIRDSFKNSDDDSSSSDLQEILKKDIKEQMDNLSTAIPPTDKTYNKLYEAGISLNNGSTDTLNGENELLNGISSLTNGLVQTEKGLEQVMNQIPSNNQNYSALVQQLQTLQDSLSSLKSGATQLVDGSSQLVDADMKLQEGTGKLISGVSLAAQKAEIDKITLQLHTDKDTLIVNAFNKTFLLASFILLIFSICGLFTDRKGNPLDADKKYA